MAFHPDLGQALCGRATCMGLSMLHATARRTLLKSTIPHGTDAQPQKPPTRSSVLCFPPFQVGAKEQITRS